MSGTPPLPIETIAPGTTLVVGSDDLNKAQTLGTLLLSMGCRTDDGVLFAATDTPGDELLAQSTQFDLDPETTEVKLIDSTGERQPDDLDVSIEQLSSPTLTDLGIKFSVVHENLSASGCKRVLAGVHTLSSILEANDLREVVRFLNSVSKRTEDNDGLMVFVVDLATHDQETLTTLSQVCDGLIEVRGTDTDDNEIRIYGLENQPTGWLPVPAPLLGTDGDRAEG